jgi:hypothetical protein
MKIAKIVTALVIVSRFKQKISYNLKEILNT